MFKEFYDLLLDRRPIAKEVKIRKDDKFFITLSTSVRRMLTISETGVFILSKCKGEKTIKEIIDEMAKTFKNVDVNEAKKDVIYCVREMEMLGLIEGYNFD